MRFMSQLRYNPKTRKDEFYYCIKESFRYLTGCVRNHVMLNVGFIEEEHRAEDICNIGKCLTWLGSHKGNMAPDQFAPCGTTTSSSSARRWSLGEPMLANGSIDVVKENN